MMRISVVIIACNEQENIGRCIDSVQGVADEVLVVDSGSTDATYRIATEKGARVVSHAWEGYSAQKNFADRVASHPWILSLDADECLSDELRRSVAVCKRHYDDEACGVVFEMNRRTAFCGRFMRRIWRTEKIMRLFHRTEAFWTGDYVHERLSFTVPGTEVAFKRVVLKGDLLHYSYTSVTDQVMRMNKYSDLSADGAFAAGRRGGVWTGILKAQWAFFRNYVLRGGFMDGGAGLIVCSNAAFYTAWKSFKLWQRYRDEPLYAATKNPLDVSAVFAGRFLIMAKEVDADKEAVLLLSAMLKKKYPCCHVLLMAGGDMAVAGAFDEVLDVSVLSALPQPEAVARIQAMAVRAAVVVGGEPGWAAWLKAAGVPMRIGDKRNRDMRSTMTHLVSVSRCPVVPPLGHAVTLLLAPLGIAPCLVSAAVSGMPDGK